MAARIASWAPSISAPTSIWPGPPPRSPSWGRRARSTSSTAANSPPPPIRPPRAGRRSTNSASASPTPSSPPSAATWTIASSRAKPARASSAPCACWRTRWIPCPAKSMATYLYEVARMGLRCSIGVLMLVSECPQKIGADRRRAPVFLDVFDHQLRACVVTDVGRILRIVHRVGKVPDQNAVDTERGHFLDGERSIEHAHVGVHAHDQEGTNIAFPEEAVNLRATVGDHVRSVDAQTGMLTRPRFVELVRRIDPGKRQNAFTLRRVLVESHGFGRRMNNLDPSLASRFQKRRHLRR